MIKYIVKRLLLLIPVLIGITFFIICHDASGRRRCLLPICMKMQERQFRRK